MTQQRLRIAFMGTPALAVPALQALYDSGHDVVCVYSQPPRPSGRGQKIQKSPIHELADARGTEVRTPLNFKNEDDVAAFRALDLDMAVVAAYGMLLPQEILDAPRHGCVNIHPSLLPRWRGTSPVQYAIWQGDAETGVSLMKLVKKMDAGPIISQKRISMPSHATYESLNEQLWASGSDMLGKAVAALAKDGVLQAVEQDESQVTYTKMLSKDDGRIHWQHNAMQIDQHIRALMPWPGTWTEINGKRMKIISAAPQGGQTHAMPGTVLNAQGDVACGEATILRVIKVQPENGKPMDFAAAVNGGYVGVNSFFS